MLRSWAAALTGLAAVLLLPVAVVAVWVDAVATDTDRYVDAVAPLADDPVVQDAATRQLQGEAVRLVTATTDGSLPAVAERAVRDVVRSTVEGPTFPPAWDQANRTAHEQLVAVLRGDDARLDSRGRVTLDLGPVLDSVTQTLASRGLVDPSRVPRVRASIPLMDADQLAHARRWYDAVDALGVVAPVAWALLVAATVACARRRLGSLAVLASASLAALGLLALALYAAREVVTTDLPEPEVARAVWDAVVASLWRAVEIAALVTAVVAVGATLLARAARGPQPVGGPDQGVTP